MLCRYIMNSFLSYVPKSYRKSPLTENMDSHNFLKIGLDSFTKFSLIKTKKEKVRPNSK